MLYILQLKYKPQCNTNSVKEWSKKIQRTTENEHNINNKMQHSLLKQVQTLLKQTKTNRTIIYFTKSINIRIHKRLTYIIIPQLRPTPTAYGISIFNIIENVFSYNLNIIYYYY